MKLCSDSSLIDAMMTYNRALYIKILNSRRSVNVKLNTGSPITLNNLRRSEISLELARSNDVVLT